jgi:hypothetical protein
MRSRLLYHCGFFLSCGVFLAYMTLIVWFATMPARPRLPDLLGPPRCYNALLTNGHVSWLGVACNTPLGVQVVSHSHLMSMTTRGKR